MKLESLSILMISMLLAVAISAALLPIDTGKDGVKTGRKAPPADRSAVSQRQLALVAG